ncbi:MAG: M20/M25/M40 family metallo-hydrolase [Thermoplasmata archaeon]|nr:M20/M25/M40 family metallo-hydrolase [Thermoplasmata archaeon]
MEERGLKVETQTVESPYIINQNNSNLYLRIGNGNGPKILLNAHLDTVSSKEGWYHGAYSGEEEDGRIYGLGAADMKGGCASALAAILALMERKDTINGELFLSFVFGEEAPFSLGTDTLLREYDFRDYDLIIVTEPSPLLAINDFCYTHKKIHKSKFPVPIIGAEGRILYDIEFFGKSAHASHPSQGINALHDASILISQLAQFDIMSGIKMGRGHYCVLSIEGGDKAFTVPSYCKILLNRQLTVEESIKTVSRELKLLIKNLRLKSKVKITPRFAPNSEMEYKPYLFEKSEYIEKFMERLPYSKGKKRCAFTTSSVGDFNLLATRTGVPTLIFGPGGGNIHAPNENSNVNEVIESANYILDFFMEIF